MDIKTNNWIMETEQTYIANFFEKIKLHSLWHQYQIVNDMRVLLEKSKSNHSDHKIIYWQLSKHNDVTTN